MEVIDLRSDFLAHPSPAMDEAGRAAAGSRQFGLREDPWQRKLEARLAALLGKEDALVFPTCTMANTTALLLQAPPGSTVVAQQGAHMLVSEANAGATFGGVWMTAVDSEGARPPLAAWQRALGVAPDAQRSPLSLVLLENTHNPTGGVALPAAYGAEVVALAHASGARVHLDGSRLFYAAAALATTPHALASGADTVSVSLNKTFGAPIAAALAGTAASIERALTIRQRLGGGLRPIGAAAAATLAGLDDLSHVAASNARAGRLADALAESPRVAVERPPEQTNIVLATLTAPWTAARLCARLAQDGVLALPVGPDRVRFVTYRGIGDAAIDTAIARVQAALREPAA